MRECTNIKVGQMLHDYELDILSTEDKQQFELHLYECENCLSHVREFMSPSRIIKFDPDARKIIEDMAGDSDEVKPERIRKAPSHFYKLLIAAIIVLVIGIPAYLYWGPPQWPRAAQTLELMPYRAGGNDIIHLEKGGDVEIKFFFAENFQGTANLIISNIDGEVILHLHSFKNFNDRGLGTITLPVSMFSDDHYMLTVYTDSETGPRERAYMFRAK